MALVLIIALAAGFALILVVFVMVVVGIREEEKRWSIVREDGWDVVLTGNPPPTSCARLARRVTGGHFTNELRDTSATRRPVPSHPRPSRPRRR